MTALTVPPPAKLTDLIPLVLHASAGSKHTARVYGRHLELFFGWYQATAREPFCKAIIREYLATIASISSRNQALTVLRKLADEAADNGLLATSTAASIGHIKPRKRHGKRTGNWLTRDQAQALLMAPDVGTLKGKRDRALLGLLLECGLRREEAAALTVEQIQQRDGRLLIADLRGKGSKLRTVPIPWRCGTKIQDWIDAAGITTGRLLRPVNMADRLQGASISTTALYQQVLGYAAPLGLSVRPHDLRRTFGKLAFAAGAPIEQIQQTYGHATIRTTEIYLGLDQDLKQAPCDVMDLEAEPPAIAQTTQPPDPRVSPNPRNNF